MFHKFLKRPFAVFICSQSLLVADVPPNPILVTNNSGGVGGVGDGSLYGALLVAGDGSIIDCSPIAGQTIGLSAHLPAIAYSFTILGSGMTIDGGGTLPVFSLAQGSATITDFIIQNGLSQGGAGGNGRNGGGGGTGGGGALYVHSGTTMTISALSLSNNQAVGGLGGDGISADGGAGAGGGGYGGGHGGVGASTGSGAGSGGGGGGNSGGTTGGNSFNGGGGGAGSPNTFSTFAGAGGGAERAVASPNAGVGGSVAATAYTPSTSGGPGGTGTASNGAGGGGGGGSGGSGSPGADAIPSGSGIGGAGGYGIGAGNTYGGGGGGGGGYAGGAGGGTGGGGGGFNGPGGAGGTLGGGGGASRHSSGGAGGFGAGGGGGTTGGTDSYGLGGAGGSSINISAGGGGGSGLGGAIFIQQGGALIIQDSTSFFENSTSAGIGGMATGSIGGNGSSIGDDIFIRSGGSVTFQVNGTVTMPSPIGGGGLLSEASGPGVVMSGAGTVNLTGANSYLGDTLIQSGTLNLNGSVSGDVQTESGGILSGNATVNGNIYNRGTISPGNSIGSTFTTDLYLYSTGIYNVEVNSAGDSDEIIASGLAQIDGELLVSPDDFNFTTPLTYTIISTGSGITGEFSLVTSLTPSLMSVIYSPLTIQFVYLPLEAVRLTGNALNAAGCFSTIPVIPGSDAVTVNNALLSLSFDDMQMAFEQMGPAQFSAVTEVQLLDAIFVRSTYTKHLQYPRCERPISLWIDGFRWSQHQKKSGNQFGYNDRTFGGTIGLDYSIRDLILGLAFSSTYDNLHVKNFASKATINSYYGGVYGQWNYGGFYTNGAILGALNRYKTTRQLSFGNIDRQAHSKHGGNEWLPHLGFGYQVYRSHFQWTPYINLDYVLQHEHSYSETGAGSLDLHVHAKNATLFQGEAGVSLSATYKVPHGQFIPMLGLAYINQTPCSGQNYHANFASSSYCGFTGKSRGYKRNLFAPHLAFTYKGFCDRINASIYYDAEVSSKYWAQDVGFSLALCFYSILHCK